MDITLVILIYFHVFVLETAYIEYAHRKKIYRLVDRIYIMSVVKFVSFLPLVIGFYLVAYYSDQRDVSWLLLSMGLMTAYLFLMKIFQGEGGFQRYIPFVSLNFLFLLWVVFFFREQQYQKINYFYSITTIGVCFIYYFFLLDKKEKKENAILYTICVLISLFGFLSIPEDNVYGLIAKAFTSGLLYLCIHVSILSQSIRLEKMNRLRAQEQEAKLEEARNQIQTMVEIDPLTGLHNLESFKRYFNHISVESNMEFSLILINIDNFKSINNIYGHPEGDKLLIKVANFLKNTTERDQSPLYRFTADHFGIVQRGKRREAEELIGKILFSDRSIEYKEHTFLLNIGIAIFKKGMSFNELYQQAEVALLEAKRRGKHRYFIFEENLMKKINRRFILEKRIQDKIEKEDFILYCQPKVSLETGKIVGGELLVKMMDEEGRFVPPNGFIRLSENAGIIDKIDSIVLTKAIRFIKEMEESGIVVPVSVNVSPQSFLKYSFVDELAELMSQSDICPQNLIIEITEHSLISNMNVAIKTAEQLRQKNIALSLDDFGSGYSSLGYLVNLPVTEVKIDRVLVKSLSRKNKQMIFLAKIIELLKELDLKIVIEGIQTDRQRKLVKECGGEVYQGYFSYKPMSLEKFKDLLRKERTN